MDKSSAAAFLCALALGIGIWIGVFIPGNTDSTDQAIFRIEKGASAKDISLRLRDLGFVRFVTPFRLFLMLTNTAHRLQAGDYMISRAMTPYAISQKFFRGEVIKERFTVIEGWNIQDIALALEAKTGISKESFTATTQHTEEYAERFSVLKDKPDTVGLEGYLFPDTYEISPSDNAQTIVENMLLNMEKKMTQELRAASAARKKSVFQILTMASLLEKELKTRDEKRMGAGILWTRLRIGMPLQVDATVEYARGSLYDTYKYRGLPPGPIANPGMESIEAALNPTESSSLYYLTKPDGTAVFSKTLEEHNTAKRLYLRRH
ncbi:MAG: endolytic transglycosylase MltG [Candidatus Wildermuthbacteria bacterium]|nr:endolytic transglycosylase MltG [Candidatus Wildermuthbacteria bacterium]